MSMEVAQLHGIAAIEVCHPDFVRSGAIGFKSNPLPVRRDSGLPRCRCSVVPSEGSTPLQTISTAQRLIAVASLAQLQDLHPGLRGILGEDFLKDFDLLIDRRKKILCLDPTREMRASIRGERISIVRQGSDDTQAILVPVRLSQEKTRTMYLRLDSGASVPILYVNPSKWEPLMGQAKALPAKVIGGTSIFFQLMAPQRIRIGNQVVSDVKFAAPVASKQNVVFAGQDGLLPTSLFERVFISYRDEFVVLNPR